MSLTDLRTAVTKAGCEIEGTRVEVSGTLTEDGRLRVPETGQVFPGTHWVFGVRVPYVESRLKRRGAATETLSGLGDVVVSVKHRFYRWVGPWADRHAAVEVGLKLPTGETDRPVGPGLPVSLRSRLQPGTGSTDGFVDVVYQQGGRQPA